MHPTDVLLQEAEGCHDDDPARAAALLRNIDITALGETARPLYAFLVNHVLGEKLGDWAEAQQRQHQLLDAAGAAAGGKVPPVLWRQAAVAARLAGDAAAHRQACAALAHAADASEEQAAALTELCAASFAVPGAEPARAGALALAALRALREAPWQLTGALDAAAAAACNNLAANLSERAPAALRDPLLREALLDAAELSSRLWLRAGQWVQHERAHYGIAVAHGALGNAAAAREAAAAGLALLDAHDRDGAERVDRAFLELELAHALSRLGQAAEATAARARADALAAGFDDPGLAAWYRARVERQTELDAG
jgi:hypothetical protein